MGTLHLELPWNLPHDFLADFHPYPFPDVNYDHEYNSFQWTLSPASERSTLKVVLGTSKLAVGMRGAGRLMDCAPFNSVGSLIPCTGNILLDYVPLFSQQQILQWATITLGWASKGLGTWSQWSSPRKWKPSKTWKSQVGVDERLVWTWRSQTLPNISPFPPPHTYHHPNFSSTSCLMPLGAIG